MASLDSLPPDQRAVLELVLRRGRNYDEIAELLSIDRAGVRERALAALDALGPQTGVPPERRALITDYLLGALPSGVAADVAERLGSSPSERAWARVVAAELQPLASGSLPEIPVEAGARAAAAEAPAVAEEEPDGTEAAAPPPRSRSRPAKAPRTSRTGGAILLAAGAAIVIAVVLVLVLSGGSDKKHASTSAAKPSGTTPTTSTAATKVVAQINLNPPSGGNARGIAEVLKEQGKTGIAIVAQGLTPNTKKPPNAYAVWLYNSPSDSHILGFVNPGVGSNGRLQTAGGLPTNASHFQKLLVTLESQSNPKSPGTIVLQGALTGL
ncbi:MAG TPA: sigma factor-like helix-turn-helix DNA-binding protein [Solirubrobacteraceae bacterium]